jgi:hypothetical protein
MVFAKRTGREPLLENQHTCWQRDKRENNCQFASKRSHDEPFGGEQYVWLEVRWGTRKSFGTGLLIEQKLTILGILVKVSRREQMEMGLYISARTS